MKTKNQHYVSRFYLEAWATQKRIFVASNDFPPKTKGTKNCASGQLFYEFPVINERIVSLLYNRIDKNLLNTPHYNFLHHMLNILKCKVIENTIKNIEQNFTLSIDTDNFLENFYGDFESTASIAIKKLLENQYATFSPLDYMSLLDFIWLQRAKTKKFYDDVYYDALQFIDKYNLTDDEVKSIILLKSIEIAFRKSIECLGNLYTLELLESLSCNLITNDNPVIKILGSKNSRIELYYPLSPTKALYIHPIDLVDNKIKKKAMDKYRNLLSTIKKNLPPLFSEDALDKECTHILKKINYKIEEQYFFKQKSISEAEAHAFNKLMWDNKYEFAYAFTQNDLTKFYRAKD